ncbi:hypothetical protein SmJEL517_g00780 [Synchytrium microbalum]|uniref:[acyl-carrier-protein] S-malonyltransferase n=1 Tax=Synchytrium microbalum TaxID=1806994 RepID=A0A507CED1_9FUNG|nr:uncharacterized protein SmJEL517_g00780 [Synchytrium microbalum]TPX37529.1 hypothetical protein SmJEL517_g00780 [Synchytrium microbalum]
MSWRSTCCKTKTAICTSTRQRNYSPNTAKRKHALLFPGQGAQHVGTFSIHHNVATLEIVSLNVSISYNTYTIGMGKDIYSVYQVARTVLDEAEEAVAGGLKSLMFDGPQPVLTQTENAQPAILSHSIALLRVLETEYGFDVRHCTYILGHSLGEYSALVAAQSVSLSDAIKLVRLRGQAMAQCIHPSRDTAMKALVVTGSLEEIESIIQRMQTQLPPGEVAEIANINSKSQVVLSGTTKGVEYASSILQTKRLAGRGISLPVSAPFHCSLMQPASLKMREALSKIAFQDPVTDVISNVTGRPFESASEIPDLLVRQITSPVQWLRSLRYANEDQVHDWVCVGPTKVQANLVKKDFPQEIIKAISTADDVKTVGPKLKDL